MPAAPPTRLPLRSPVQLAAVVPHLLGFRPVESLVLLGISGRRQRVGLTLRADLAQVNDHPGALPDLVARLRRQGADAVLAVVVTAAPGLPPDLPFADVVQRLRSSVPVRDAVLLRAGRCWSYACDSQDCCPRDGRLVDPTADEVVRVDAAYAAVGRAVLDDRDAVAAQLRPVSGDRAVAAAAAVPRALSRVSALGVDRLRRWTLRRLGDLTDCADPRAAVPPELAVGIAVALDLPAVRDAVIARWARETDAGDGPRRDAWRRVLLDLARTAPAPYDAPVCAVFGCLAYDEGDGVLVAAAVARALASDPAYGLARLLAACLADQVHPRRLRAVWLEADDVAP